MHAQLVQCGTTPERRAEMDRIVADELIPALRQEPGFASTLSLVDPDTGEAMLVVLWDSAEQAGHPPSERGNAFVSAFGRVAALASRADEPPSTWEVDARI